MERWFHTWMKELSLFSLYMSDGTFLPYNSTLYGSSNTDRIYSNFVCSNNSNSLSGCTNNAVPTNASNCVDQQVDVVLQCRRSKWYEYLLSYDSPSSLTLTQIIQGVLGTLLTCSYLVAMVQIQWAFLLVLVNLKFVLVADKNTMLHSVMIL